MISIFKYGQKELSREEAGIMTDEDISNLDGVYVFIIEGCGQCINLVKQLNHQGIDYSDWKFVQVLGNMKFFMEDMELEDMPTTQYYVDGIVRWEQFGVLFPPQVRQLEQALAIPRKGWNEVS